MAAFVFLGEGDSESSVTGGPDPTESEDADEAEEVDDSARVEVPELDVSHLELDGWAMDEEMLADGFISFYAAPEGYDFESDFGVVIGAQGPLEDGRELYERAYDAAITFTTTTFFSDHTEASLLSEEPITIDGYDGFDTELLVLDQVNFTQIYARTVLFQMDTQVVAFIGFTNQFEDDPIHKEMTDILDSIETTS